MDMTQLIGYGAPDGAVAAWRAKQGEQLLPLQARAVREFDLFGGGNLLVQAPTSSGKTFVGEMAAVAVAAQRRKAVYLAPLKALAAEKHAIFADRYAALGLRVIVSSRERREFDGDFERGHFDLAVVVYEKFAQLLAWRPERLNEIGLVVADELDLLCDPERGAGVEMLLARLLAAGRRIIGLSAVMPEADRVAEWLNARLITHDRRPVELRYGVLHDGQYRYRTHNDGTEGAEPMINTHGASSWESLTQNVRALAEGGETCLIFVKAKHEARRGAELLAARLRLPGARDAADDLRGLPPTRARDTLMHTLSNGVAFHNTDLTPEERRVAEEAFRGGAARVMVSTGTLAVGMNLPAANVFVSADKWIYDPRFDLPWKTPIDHGEYENMSGRAGRFGAGRGFGRSILVAATPFDADSLWRCYVQGSRPPLDPPLARMPLEDHALRLAASRCCRTPAEMTAFFDGTLSARVKWHGRHLPGETAHRVRAALHHGMEAGALRPLSDPEPGAPAEPGPNDPVEATPFGRAVAAKGVSIATALEIRHWLRASRQREWLDIDLILALALTPDGRMRHVSLTAREYEHADYPGRLKLAAASQECSADSPLNRMRCCRLTPFFDEVRSIKAALFLGAWIDHAGLPALEDEFDTAAGQVLTAADQLAWLADATAAVADALDMPQPMAARIAALAERLALGLREEALPMVHAAGGLPRAAAVALCEAGLHTPRALLRTPDAALARLVSEPAVRALRAWAEQNDPDADGPARDNRIIPPALLVVDDRRPNEVRVLDIAIPLQDKQYRLIRLLAARPGECVPYEEIYRAVWGDTIVENNQMHFQKSLLLKRIAAVAPEWSGIIKSVPRRGFVLDLPLDQVSRIVTVPTAA
jgi:helicase